MDEDKTTAVSDQQVEDSVETHAQVEEPKKENVVAYETHKRLLGEKKRRDAQLGEALEKLKSYEQADLEQKGETSKLIEALRKENSELKSTYETDKQRYAQSVIKHQISLEAQKLGCVDTDALYKLHDFDDVEVDDNYKVNVEDLARSLTNASEKYSYIFQKKAAPIKDRIPSGDPKDMKKGLNEMGTEELARLINKTL